MKQELRRRIEWLLFFCIPFFKYRISGESMSPTLKNNDIVLVNRLAYLFYSPTCGDVVACHDPRGGKVLIKRIAKIENNRYFVLGDNLEHSTDSRKFGMIEKSAIVGKVLSLEAKSKSSTSSDPEYTEGSQESRD
jgi:nickel-type superoxide dismutase maturation protease